MGSISILTYCSIFTNTNRHDAPYSLLSIHTVCCLLRTCTSYIAPPPNVRHNQQTNCASCTSISMLGASDRLQMLREPMDREVVDLCPSLQHRVYCCIVGHSPWKRLLLQTERRFSDVCQSESSGSGRANHCRIAPSPYSPSPPPPPYTHRVSNLSLTLRRPPLSLN